MTNNTEKGKTRTNHIAHTMHKRGWSHKTPPDGLRRRLYHLAVEHHPVWDWGHRVMTLTGSDAGDSEPVAETWWYRRIPTKPAWRTGYPRFNYEIIKDWDKIRVLTEGLNEDQMWEWQAVGLSQDHDLHLGHQYWGGDFHGLPRKDLRVLRRWMRYQRRFDWFGLRTWLYSMALHAALNQRKPFTCQATPPPGAGGYSHWHCDLPRRHAGLHRAGHCRWGEIGGEQIPVTSYRWDEESQ